MNDTLKVILLVLAAVPVGISFALLLAWVVTRDIDHSPPRYRGRY